MTLTKKLKDLTETFIIWCFLFIEKVKEKLGIEDITNKTTARAKALERLIIRYENSKLMNPFGRSIDSIFYPVLQDSHWRHIFSHLKFFYNIYAWEHIFQHFHMIWLKFKYRKALKEDKLILVMSRSKQLVNATKRGYYEIESKNTKWH